MPVSIQAALMAAGLVVNYLLWLLTLWAWYEKRLTAWGRIGIWLGPVSIVLGVIAIRALMPLL